MPIREQFAAVEARIAAACERAGRSRNEVTLVAVSKTFPAEAVDEAIAAGATTIGENRVQEVRDKKPLVHGSARWHLIGHLQSNKAKDAVKLFDVIETIDSVELAEKLARAAGAAGKRQSVMLQVNIGEESQKNGLPIADVESVAAAVRKLETLDLRGVMAIPPDVGAEAARPYFRALRKLRDDLGLPDVSMGMSEDFEVAIEEGSTLVRVGRAIFGSRG